MKKFFKKIAFVSAMAMVVSAVPAQTAKAAEGPQMYSSLKMYLGRGEDEEFSSERYAKVWNWKDEYTTVKFTSDNEDVATVTAKKGLVTAQGVGSANITAKFTDEDGNSVERVCKVTVKNNAVEAGIGSGSAEKLLNLTVGDSKQMYAYRIDANGAEVWSGRDDITDGVRFASSDESVFTVGKKKGMVTAVGAGEATLSVWAVQSEGVTRDENGVPVEYPATTEVKEYPVVVKEPAAEEVVFDKAKLSSLTDTLTADGASSTLITFTLYEAEGVTDTTTKDVQVALETTRGALAVSKATLENGVVRVLYTAPILTSAAVAQISATIVSASAEDQALINTQAAPIYINLVPSQVKDDTVDNTGAKVLKTVVQTADRITLFFNKEVKSEDFMYLVNGNYVMTKDNGGVTYKFDLELDDDIEQTATAVAVGYEISEANVVNVLQNTADSVTLVLNQALTDNSKYALNFVDQRYNAVVTTTGQTGYVTDAIIPSMLRVQQYNQSMTQILVTFSEPIDPATITADTTKIAIDSTPLSGAIAQLANDKWGVGTTATAIMNPVVANTSRNQYIITLGQDAFGNQIYFTAGSHSLTVNNVGDYAYNTDNTNQIATATLDFYIVGNTQEPTYTVTVMSPEQYKVDFNCVVAQTAALQSILQLQYYNTATSSWVAVSGLGAGQTYEVSLLDSGVTSGKTSALIEVQKDWTEVLVGSKTNYYNYGFRVYSAAGTLSNVANGKTNVEIARELNDTIMKQVDYTSPAIVGEIEEVTTGTTFKVTFNEPIQAPGVAGFTWTDMSDEKTPSTAQTAGNDVPVVTAQIVEAGLKNTYDAVVSGINETDNTLTITVIGGTLAPATSYILYVRSVSDDIGNTSNTVYKGFTTNGVAAVETDFQIAGVWADAALENVNGIYDLTEVAAGAGAMDAIYVEFTAPFATYGGVKTVLTNTNWTLNGASLPAGSYIVSNIVGDNRLTGVTIILPDGTITDINNTIITLSNQVEDVNGKKLKGETRVKTQFPADITGEYVVMPTGYLGKVGKFSADVAGLTITGAALDGLTPGSNLTFTLGGVSANAASITLVIRDASGNLVEQIEGLATTATTAAITQTYTTGADYVVSAVAIAATGKYTAPASANCAFVAP
ncbi:MAG: Ig-like domain-containing protein [Lachnospiraceae bacterium]|nr:Ig-like domain-containing protein [Lachnospiraceae bacterium]